MATTATLTTRVIVSSFSWSGDTVPAEHDRDRPQQDPEVQRERCVRDVLHVELVHLEHAQTATPAHLPQTGDPGLHQEAAVHPVRVALDGVRDIGPRAHEAHLPAKDVPEL